MPDSIINIPYPVKGGFIPAGGGFSASRAKQTGDSTSIHTGLDIAVANGTPVYAPLAGIVVILATNARAGIQMQIQHANGYTTGYAHLSSIVVADGASVTANQLIAFTGATGDAAGPPPRYHLHFTLSVNGVRVDPYPYLQAQSSAAQSNSTQYTPQNTTPAKGKDYFDTIVVDDKFTTTVDKFINKYHLTVSSVELMAYRNNSDNILNAYTKAQKFTNKNQANANQLNVGTKIHVPLNKMKSNNPYRVNQNLLINLDYKTFIEAEIGKLIKSPQYKRLNLIGNDSSLQDGAVLKRISECSVWLWSKVVSPNGNFLIDLSPFVKNLNISVSKDGGNFTISLPHISFSGVKKGSANDLPLNANLTPAQISSLYQLPIINSSNYQSGDFNFSGFVSKGTSHEIDKVNVNGFALDPPSKDEDISNDPHFFKLKNSLFHHIIQANDIIFIRMEKLEIDADNYFDLKEGYAVIRNTALEGSVFDMIALVDSSAISLSGSNNTQEVQISGRDLSKLLIDDGVFFFPIEYEVDSKDQIIKNSGKSKSGNRLTIPIPPDGNSYYNNLKFNAPGNIISDTKFNFDVTQTVGDWLLFIFQQLTNIKICPNGLFNSYKDKTFIVSRTDKFKADGSFGYQRILADGIWQGTKLVLDPNISERKVVDSSLSTDTGSLLNLIRKVCQEPFAEFTSDTYGNKFYFILRKPPYVQASFTTNKIINIFDYDVESSAFDFHQDFYTWFRLTPMGSIIDTSNGSMMQEIPAVMLPEFVDLWGTKILDVQTNYLDFYLTEAEDTSKILQNILQQANEDLDWMIEANAYLPFARTGSITIKADRRIKRGMCVRFFPTGEVFHVDAVNNTRTFENSTYASTTLSVSRGLVEKHFSKYFSIVNLKRNGKDKNTWGVNKDIFNFFLNKQQFL